MKNQFLFQLRSGILGSLACFFSLTALLISCESPLDQELSDQVSVAHLNKGHDLPHTELATVRRVVARYHNIKHALADGYTLEFTGYRSQMGFHYLKPELLDDRFELERPEVLVYVPAPNGGLRFVAVEYATVVPDMSSPPPAPEGFSGSADVWALNTEFEVWTLHAWVGLNNPNGIFAPRNPRLP